MLCSHSTRYLPRQKWPVALRDRALSEPIKPDPGRCLEAFRQHSDFYSDRLRGITTWCDIPTLQKDQVKNVPIRTHQALYETRSSGTTGEQVIVRNTITERRFRQALAYRPFLFYPIHPESDNIIRQLIFVDGTKVDAVDKQQWPFEFGGHCYLTWHVGIAAPPGHILALLRTVRPQVVRGLTSGIVRFVGECTDPIDQLGTQIVSPSGEQMSDHWRTLLTDAFSAPVLDRYGATETGSIAWQCPYCAGYHINSDEIIVEDSSDGIICTPLYIESQPLLRYRLGDQVTLDTDPTNCQVRLPTLTIRDARRDDWIIDGAGKNISPLSFQFERIEGLKTWHLHQSDSGKLHLYFDVEAGKQNIQMLLGRELERIVPDRSYELIHGPWSPSGRGKFKRVSSDIKLRQLPGQP